MWRTEGGEISKDQTVAPSVKARTEAKLLDLYIDMRPRVCNTLALCTMFAFVFGDRVSLAYVNLAHHAMFSLLLHG